MFDTVILLTGPVEEAVLASVLREHNPQLDIRGVKSLADLETLKPELLARARLIGFVTPVIVPKRVLEGLGYGAYNFHPGPPHYPGWVPSHFAIYDGATEFGATAHVMNERVDTGPIVGVELFGIRQNTTVEGLEQLALTSLARLFWNLANLLATHSEPLNPLEIAWSGRRTTRQNYAALCEVSAEISKDELERRIGVFGAGHFGQSPTITLHGHRFRYVAPEPAALTSPTTST
jgi:folate-dependent phosphoribosylglycinamide formyltransferase PurN